MKRSYLSARAELLIPDVADILTGSGTSLRYDASGVGDDGGSLSFDEIFKIV